MQKIILDTNVIVSALIASSIPTRIIYDLVLTESVEICLSEDIFNKYVEVLSRDKFSKIINFKSKADIVLAKIREISTIFTATRKIEILTDTSDNKFLELAAISRLTF